MNRRQETINDLLKFCTSFTVAELDALDDWQLFAIDATDTNWCLEPEALEWNDTVDEAVSKALYATYEQVTDKNATPDNY